MAKNNFGIPNYIHLSFQGYLDDKMNQKRSLQANSVVKKAKNKLRKDFQKETGMSVEQFLETQAQEIDTMSAMISLFSAGKNTEKNMLKPFSEIWAEYGKYVEDRINSLNLSSEEKSALLEYTEASAKANKISISLSLLYGKNKLKIKELREVLGNVTKDFDEKLLEDFREKIKTTGGQNKDWAHLLINQAAYEAFRMANSLEKLNNVKTVETNFGQLIGTSYTNLKNSIDSINNLYNNGANSRTILSEVNKARRLFNTQIKGIGTESISFINLPVVQQSARDITVQMLHTGLDKMPISYKDNIQFLSGKKEDIQGRNFDFTREVSLADTTIIINTDDKQGTFRISRKTYNPNIKSINLGALSVGQAITLIQNSYGGTYNFFNGKQSFTFYNAMNFMFMRKNMWYKAEKNTMRLIWDRNSRARTMGSFTGLKAVEETLNTQILTSFLVLAYSTFFISRFAALYDINNFIVPSPILFEYGINRVSQRNLQTGIQRLISYGAQGNLGKMYEQEIRNAGSGEKGIIWRGRKAYPIYLMALRRNNTAFKLINNSTITVQSYNITNKEYYYSMFQNYK